MRNRSDRRGNTPIAALAHLVAVATIGAPRADFHHGQKLHGRFTKKAGDTSAVSTDSTGKIALMHGPSERGKEKGAVYKLTVLRAGVFEHNCVRAILWKLIWGSAPDPEI